MSGSSAEQIEQNRLEFWAEMPDYVHSVRLHHELPFTPRTWKLLTSEAKDDLKLRWSISDGQLRIMCDDADLIASDALRETWHEKPDRKPIRDPALQLRQLRYALDDLVKREDEWSSDPSLREYVPSLYSSKGRLKKCVIRASAELNALPPKTKGRKIRRSPSANRAARRLVDSWALNTGRVPNGNKLPPSVNSFYATLLPLLRVRTACWVHFRDGSQKEDFFEMNLPESDEDSPQRWLDAMPHIIKSMTVKAARAAQTIPV